MHGTSSRLRRMLFFGPTRGNSLCNFEKENLEIQKLSPCWLDTDLIKTGRTILRPTMALTSLPTNTPNAIRLTIPKVGVSNLWGILNGGIIVVMHGRRI